MRIVSACCVSGLLMLPALAGASPLTDLRINPHYARFKADLENRPSYVLLEQDSIDQLAGKIISSIHLDVEGRRDDAPDVMALVDVQVGKPLSLADLRTTITRMYGAGRFDDIRVRGVANGANVDLIIDLVPRHPVDQVLFSGVPASDAADLERALRQRFNGLPRGSQADTAARGVERTLAERGYRAAKVTPSIETSHLPDRATLRFTIQPGVLTVVGSARVEGASPLAPAEILKRVGVAVGQPYRVRDIDLGLDTIIEELRARGYYDASVSHARDVISPDEARVDVVITVDSAVPVSLKFVGDPLPGKASELVPITREGSADDDLLEDSVRRIEAALRREGYWKGQASFTRTETPASKVITFTVTRGQRYRFERLEMSGNAHMTTAALAVYLPIEPGAYFDESIIARGVALIREAYRQQGYAAAVVTMTPESLPPAKPGGEPRVIERIVVDEGVQTKVAEIVVTGASRVPPAELLAVMRLKRDGPFVAALVPGERDVIRQKYDERGYGSVIVEVRSRLSDDRTRATIQVDVVAEGPQTLLGHVIIAGNKRVTDATIRSAVQMTMGQPFGMSARLALQQRLSALGLFRRVAITEAPHPGGQADTDIIITVEESTTTTMVYGGGIEAGFRARSVLNDQNTIDKVDKFEVAPRGSFEIGRTNLWGKDRSITFSSGVSLRAKDDADDPTQDGTCCGFSEYRAVASYRDQQLFGWNASGLVSLSAEQAIRNSFNFLRQNLGVQTLRRLNKQTSWITGYSLERVKLSNVRIAEKDRLLVDRLFPQVRLSILSTSLIRDTRTEQVDDGSMLSVDSNLAMRAIGSQVGFAKIFTQAFVYRRIDSLPRVVLAGGARIGIVRGFAQTIDGQDVELVPASQRFFSGGSTSVRGFQQDRLGAPDILDGDGLSNGGNGLMVFNAEARTSLTKSIAIAAFIDAGNVFSKVSAMHFGEMRTSVGTGLRYKSPIGPLRFDVGWKVGTLRITDSRRWEFHFSIGEAF